MADKPKPWRQVLSYLVNKAPKTFTAGDLVEQFGFTYPGAAQTLRRLQMWGNIRIVGFQSPQTGLGRRRKVYEVTENGRRSNEYYWRNRKKRS